MKDILLVPELAESARGVVVPVLLVGEPEEVLVGGLIMPPRLDTLLGAAAAASIWESRWLGLSASALRRREGARATAACLPPPPPPCRLLKTSRSDMRMGGAFRPASHSSAVMAASWAAVSGYRSSWKSSDLRGTVIVIISHRPELWSLKNLRVGGRQMRGMSIHFLVLRKLFSNVLN